VRHNLGLAAIWELPIGRGRRWLADASPWVEALGGGWSLASIWKAHSGFALTVFAPDQSQTGARTGRPDRTGTGSDPREVGPGRLWFDTSVFQLPRLGTFGNEGVGTVGGPGFNVVDLAVTKRVNLPKGLALEVRAEAFNLFNTPVFSAPDRNLTSATFGQVLGSQLEREIQLGVKVTW
jgi:hypothetical protein